MHNVFDPLSAKALEKHRLRNNANYIGVMMLALEAAMFLLGTLLQGIVQLFSPNKTAFLLIYSVIYSIGMALPPIVVSLLTKRRCCPLSPAESVDPADAFFGILAAVGICMAANITVNILMAFFESVGIPEPEMPDYLEANIPSLLLNLFVFAVLPALLEELVFRGYVLRSLRAYGDWFAVVVSALLFGLMHGNIAQIPFAFIVGMALGWLYVATNNIWIPVAVHFVNNGFSLLLQYCTIGLSDTKIGKMNIFSICTLIVIGALSLAVLVIRRSALFRCLSGKSDLSVTARIGTIFSSSMFVVCILVFSLLTVIDVLGSMR